eukprot:366319-Chlamydomonas_euryale.AAC.8
MPKHRRWCICTKAHAVVRPRCRLPPTHAVITLALRSLPKDALPLSPAAGRTRRNTRTADFTIPAAVSRMPRRGCPVVPAYRAVSGAAAAAAETARPCRCVPHTWASPGWTPRPACGDGRGLHGAQMPPR